MTSWISNSWHWGLDPARLRTLGVQYCMQCWHFGCAVLHAVMTLGVSQRSVILSMSPGHCIIAGREPHIPLHMATSPHTDLHLPPGVRELVSTSLATTEINLDQVKEVLAQIKVGQNKQTDSGQVQKPSKPSPVRSLSSSGIHRNKYTRLVILRQFLPRPSSEKLNHAMSNQSLGIDLFNVTHLSAFNLSGVKSVHFAQSFANNRICY